MRTVLKMVMFPVALIVDLFTWACCGLLSCSAFLFASASSVVIIVAVAVLLTCSLTNGLILFAVAFLVSPMGLPMIAAWLLSGLQSISIAIKRI